MSHFCPAILSASVDRAWMHVFEKKVREAAKHGFQGIEVFYKDLDYLARQIHIVHGPSSDQILSATRYTRKIFDKVSLTVIGLEPFLLDEGLLDREQHAVLIRYMQLWFQVAKILKTNTMQIPAGFLPVE
jgi:4-hydroxyphenylpyruvate dioxygenase